MGTYWSLENLVYYFFSVLLSHLFVLYMIKDTDCVCNFCVNKDRLYVIWSMPACLLTLWISRSKVMSAGLLTITECLKYLLVYHCFISNSIQHHLDAHNTSWKKYPKNIPFWFSGRGSGLSLMQPRLAFKTVCSDQVRQVSSILVRWLLSAVWPQMLLSGPRQIFGKMLHPAFQFL